MAYVVQESCVECKYGDCVEVCPVQCFYEGPTMLHINPDECIDCDACVSACPVDAIVVGDDADPHWTELNKNFKFTEETRRTFKIEVSHGPKWDPKKAA